MLESNPSETRGLAVGDRVRIHTDDPMLEDVNGIAGRIVHCEDAGGDAGMLASGCLVELDDVPQRLEPRRVWVTIDKLIRL